MYIFIEPFNFSFFSITGQGIDLDYCDIEWFALEKVGLKLNIQKTKIMASGPITSWEIDGATVETVSDFNFGLPNHCRW